MAKSAFGQRLKSLFDNAVNAEIAAKLGVSEAAVGTYVRGRIPDGRKLIEIAKLTNCNLHWLLTGEGPRYIGDEKVFDLEYSIERHDDWLDVLNDWYDFEGRPNPMPETMGASFMGGWESFDRKQKIAAIRDLKMIFDRMSAVDEPDHNGQ